MEGERDSEKGGNKRIFLQLPLHALNDERSTTGTVVPTTDTLTASSFQIQQ